MGSPQHQTSKLDAPAPPEDSVTFRHGTARTEEVDDMSRKPSGPAERSLADTSPLSDRPEWLGPRDIQEVFGIGRTKSYQVINALPHIRVGGLIRVNRRTVQKELLDKGRLP